MSFHDTNRPKSHAQSGQDAPDSTGAASTSSPGYGHNSGDASVSAEDHKAWLIQQIAAFAETKNPRVLSAAELRALGGPGDGFRRLLALNKSIMVNLHGFYKRFPDMDRAPGLLTVLSLLSDDERYGGATISIYRLAGLLCCSSETIEAALKKLRAGEIEVVPNPGFTSLNVPRVSPLLADPALHLIHVLDALSPAPERAKRGSLIAAIRAKSGTDRRSPSAGRPAIPPSPGCEDDPPGPLTRGVRTPGVSSPLTPPVLSRDDSSLHLSEKKKDAGSK